MIKVEIEAINVEDFLDQLELMLEGRRATPNAVKGATSGLVAEGAPAPAPEKTKRKRRTKAEIAADKAAAEAPAAAAPAAEAPAAAAPAAEAPAATEPTVGATYEDLRMVFKRVVDEKGREAVVGILKSFEAAKVSEVPEDKLPEIIAAANKILAE